jgi:hypothetical protein
MGTILRVVTLRFYNMLFGLKYLIQTRCICRADEYMLTLLFILVTKCYFNLRIVHGYRLAKINAGHNEHIEDTSNSNRKVTKYKSVVSPIIIRFVNPNDYALPIG